MFIRHTIKAVCLVVGLALLCAICVPAGANPAPDPSAFQVMPASGLACTPAFTSGQLAYTFTLSSGAYLVYEQNLYPITLVWGLFAVNNTGISANDIQSAGSDIGEWDWDQKPNNGDSQCVAGWLDAPKKEALVTPLTGSVSKTFTYSQFDFTGDAPLLGLHVTISLPDGAPSPFGCGLTGYIIPTTHTTVPEPPAVLALLTGIVGLAGVARRRRA